MFLDAVEDEAFYILKRMRERLSNISTVKYTKTTHAFSDGSGSLKIEVQLSNGVKADIVWNLYSIGGKQTLWELTPFIMESDSSWRQMYDTIGNLDAADVLERLTDLSKHNTSNCK